MHLLIQTDDLRAIEVHGEATYPNEGAGFLLGRINGDAVTIEASLPIDNKREAQAQYNRYELTPQDFARAEFDADQRGLEVIGVFHSHPDHPAQPSQFDLDHALPNFAYLITSVEQGKAVITHAWRLRDDRAAFQSDTLLIRDKVSLKE